MNNVGKILSILLLSMVLVFSITACGGEINDQEEGLEEDYSSTDDSQDDNNKDKDESVDEKEEEDSSKEEEVVDPNDIQGEYFTGVVEEEQALSSWIESKKHKSGVYPYPDDEKVYLIAAGEQNTGGYSVYITKENLDGEDLNLHYNIQAPGPDEMVTQAITYPYLVIEVTVEVAEVNFIKQ